MSRWLWALLGGVVLVAIAAPSGQPATRRMSLPLFRRSQRPSLPRRRRLPLHRSPRNPRRRRLPPHLRRKPRRHLRRRPCCRPQPRPRPRRPLPLARPRLGPSSRRSLRLLPLRSLRLPIRRRMQDRKRRRRLLSRRALAGPAPPVVAQAPPSAPAAPVAEPPLPPPAPGREAQQVAGVFAPKNLAQLVGAWAYSEGDCDRLFQRRGGGWAFRQPVDKFAQAAIVESPKDPSSFRHLPDRWRV